MYEKIRFLLNTGYVRLVLNLIESSSSGLYKPSVVLNIEFEPQRSILNLLLEAFLGVILSLSYY